MAATNINKVVLTGNLTRDPELRSTPSGFQICELRVAVNTRRKDNQSGDWVDKPNYFDVKIFGRQGENAAQYLSKGRPVAVDGRLDWSEWQDKDTGKNRQKVEIVAENIQFLGGRDDAGAGNGDNGGGQRFTPQTDVPADTGDFSAAPAGGGGGGGGAQDDDIPF
jgi:single-strand DNA-binding protein